jgi:hypothetical protein
MANYSTSMNSGAVLNTSAEPICFLTSRDNAPVAAPAHHPSRNICRGPWGYQWAVHGYLFALVGEQSDGHLPSTFLEPSSNISQMVLWTNVGVATKAIANAHCTPRKPLSSRGQLCYCQRMHNPDSMGPVFYSRGAPRKHSTRCNCWWRPVQQNTVPRLRWFSTRQELVAWPEARKFQAQGKLTKAENELWLLMPLPWNWK